VADVKFEYPELYGELVEVESEKWYTVYTKPKREKKLAEYAHKNGITYYLPLIESHKEYERKKVVYTKPLFSNYIFIRFPQVERQTLTNSGHTVSFLTIRNERHFLEELKAIHRIRDNKIEMTEHHYIEKGKFVRFISGPLKGVIGKVADTKNIKEVVIQVNMLKQAVAVKAESNQLEVLSDREVELLELNEEF
jgi:transcription antitermination factor NusG